MLPIVSMTTLSFFPYESNKESPIVRGFKTMKKEHNYYVYIMTNKSKTLYTGMTNDLLRRVYEHKHKLVEGFTKKYNITKLVFFDQTSDVNEAIALEKKIKRWTRAKKIALIESQNPNWLDLSQDWY
jgi:putative endonuclease